jgi:colanic acid/amylovoran biosynthesis glycosyltransferase
VIRREFLSAAEGVFRRRQLDALERKTRLFPNVFTQNGTRDVVPREGPFKILFVGRLARIKGVETLLRAIPLIGRPVELTLVGDGPLRPELERLAEGLPVRFAGEVAFGEVGRFLASSQVLVLPSLSENLPNVVLEALAAGLPVVASRVGAVPELIQDGVNGYIVEPGDAHGIAARLRQLCDSDEHCRALGRGAMESVRPFTAEVLVPTLEHELRSIIERHAHTT